MNTPIADFVRAYAGSGAARLHMPGHKGAPFLGCEGLDVTEISGADSLYEASGIIAQSEENAGALFGSGRTFFVTEGSSQCIRAMLALAVWEADLPAGVRPVVVAARNAHKAFLYAAALLDVDVVWLWPEGDARSVCACGVPAEALERTLRALPSPPAAAYVTSPDYLGGQCDTAALAACAHRFGVPLLVDNAHGAYLKFLSPSKHPLDLGADLCCDSAHKTLPVLTGGAYLHTNRRAPASFAENGRQALALFGSTSPSYLVLQSLDLCNRYLSGEYPLRLEKAVLRLEETRSRLRRNRWAVTETDPLKLTVDCAASGWDGRDLANRLREARMECEYCDADDLVTMWTPENPEQDYQRLLDILGKNGRPPRTRLPLPVAKAEAVCTIREAMLRPWETVPARASLGRVCGAPAVSCPPAIPIAAAGERIGREAVELFARCGIEYVNVLKE